MTAVRRSITLFAAVLALCACQEDGPNASESTGDSPRPDLLSFEKMACERDGGRWGPAQGKSVFVCYRDLADAGRGCLTADDCDGLCLARSRSCSPIEPFFGCHEVLLKGGQPATLCID